MLKPRDPTARLETPIGVSVAALRLAGLEAAFRAGMTSRVRSALLRSEAAGRPAAVRFGRGVAERGNVCSTQWCLFAKCGVGQTNWHLVFHQISRAVC